MAVLSKKTMNFTYGMGAAVVIMGALFKIQHYPGASALLIIGLCTEAVIFALSAFEPVEHELDWSLVYPELAGGEKTEKKEAASDDADGMLSSKLEEILKMLQEIFLLLLILSLLLKNTVKNCLWLLLKWNL